MAGGAASRGCSTPRTRIGRRSTTRSSAPIRKPARKSLYFDPGKIVYFVGVEETESDELIAELKERMIAPQAEYHHVWRKGDIVIWDNRCSYHKAAGDYPPEEDRIHWRVSINDFGVEALEAAE